MKSSIENIEATKGTVEYDQSRRVFNRLIDRFPHKIYRPKSIFEIQQIVNHARKFGLKISVKNGGHSAYGQSIVHDQVLIDMASFDQIELASDCSTVTIGGGVLSRNLESALKDTGYAVPLGDCPDVGVCGLALGGGNGFLSRRFGLACDLIIGAKMVVASGEVLEISCDQNEELLWALKGAGQNNFGVVTELTFKLCPIPEKVTVINCYWPLKKIYSVFRLTEKLIASEGADLALYIRINRSYHAKPTIRLYGIHLGNELNKQTIRESIDHISDGLLKEVYRTSYFDAQQINASSISPNVSFHWENSIVDRSLTDELAKKILSGYSKCPSTFGRINIDLLGGKINSFGSSESAFVHRNGRYILSVIGVWSEHTIADQMLNWTQDTMKNLNINLCQMRYQNYAGMDYDSETYFGAQVKKLKKLKRKWDSDSIFLGLLN